MAADKTILEKFGVARITLGTGVSCKPGDFIGWNGTAWVLATNAAGASVSPRYIATAYAKAATEVEVATRVRVYDLDAPYTAGAMQFLGAAGVHTETNPLAATVHLQVVGQAVSTTEAFLDVQIQHFFVPFSIVATAAATAANYGNIWVAPENVRFIGGWESHTVAGSDGSAVTLDVEKLSATTALDSGTAITSATVSLKSTADTPQVISPNATAATARVAAGQRVALKDAGTLTAVAGLSGCLVFVRDA